MKVFQAFDLDNSGYVEAEELQLLGQQRKTLGQKERVWTQERNAKLIAKMDISRDGLIDQEEFLVHFLEALEFENDEVFSQTMEDFLECAKHERAKGKASSSEGTASSSEGRPLSLKGTNSNSKQRHSAPRSMEEWATQERRIYKS